MALILGSRPGDVFYIGDVPVKAVSFDGYASAVIEIKGKQVPINELRAVEILPKVFLSCGRPTDYQLRTHAILVGNMEREIEERKKNLLDGKLTTEEYDNLPVVEPPYPLLPRLIINAPKEIPILRASLYKRKHRFNAGVKPVYVA